MKCENKHRMVVDIIRITKISGLQVFWMILSLNLGMPILLTMTPTIAEAQQDAWICMVVGGLVAMGITFIAVKLSLLYPNQTLVQFSQKILGSWLGKILMIPYFVMWYSVIGIILRQSADFLHAALFHTTPLWIHIFMLSLIILYGTYQGGIEGIGRYSEVAGPVIILTLCVSLFLSIPNLDWHFVLPVYVDTGWFSIVKGTIAPIAFLGDTTMVMMLVPFIEKPKMILTRTLLGMGTAILFLVFSTITVILTFSSNLPSKMWYPFFDVIRYISIMEFIQNIDVLVVILWLFSVFIKLSLYVFITSYGTAQWLNLKDWRKLIGIVLIIAFVLSLLPPNMDVSSIDYMQEYWNPYVLPVNALGIPLLLWIVGIFRKKSAVR